VNVGAKLPSFKAVIVFSLRFGKKCDTWI
jgi:hypothetical protein